MSVASTWFDLVVGVDLHFEIVPACPAPVPFPHPFVGVVFDPMGLVVDEIIGAGMALIGLAPPAGPVLVGGSLATATGDEASMPTGHILLPPGVSWAPIPKVPVPGGAGRPPAMPDLPAPPAGDAMLLMGSQTVQWRGGRAVRAGDPALSCSDPVRLPTSFVVPLATPGTVIVGGPPAIDWAALAFASGFAALRTRWASKLAHAGIEKFVPKRLNRVRDFLHDAACFVTGHPVNVVNGSMFTTWSDFELPGPIPLSFTRRYRSSFCDRNSVLGYGWSHSLDERVWLEEGRVVHLTDDGRELEYDTWDLPDRVMRKDDAIFDPISRTTLRALGQFRWEIRGADGLTRTFAPIAGEHPEDRDRGLSRLVQLRNRGGDAITLRYDEDARLTEVLDSAGRSIELRYDGRGRLSSIRLPSPNGDGMEQHVGFEQSYDGDLVGVTDALGHSVRFEYDQHNLVKETDRNGLSFHFEYEGWGPFARCTRTWGDGGLYDHLLTYDVKGRRTVVEDSLGEPTVYEWGPYGLVKAITDARGGVTRYEYDDHLRRAAEIDPLGNATRTTYDARGNPIMVVRPDKAITKIQYDDHDVPISLRTPKDAQWRWTYDATGRPTTETDPVGGCTRLRYDDDGRCTIVEDPAGNVTRLKRDAQGNLTEQRDPDGSVHRWRHDARGRTVEAIDPGGNARRSSFNALGQLVQLEEPDGNVRQLKYDGEGNVVRARDHVSDVRLTYQGLGKPTARTIGGTTVRFEYDTEERLVAFVNERGDAYRYARDPVGDVQAEFCFDDARRLYTRDLAGRPTKVFRPGVGISTTYEHDPAGRLTKATHSDGLEEAFGYDEDGALVEARNGEATVTFERDAMGRVVQERCGETWVRSQYDLRGRRIGLESSLNARIETTHDSIGRATRVVATRGSRRWEAQIARDALGLEVDRQLPGHARAYWWRDDLGRPVQHWIGRGQARQRARRYTWGVGDRLGVLHEEGQGSQRFAHDVRGFLVSTTYPDGHVDVRSPDPVGNLFRSTDHEDREFGLAGDLTKERTPEGIRTRCYDPEGNLVRLEEPNGGVWHYAWNGAGHLVEVARPDGRPVTFTYDALGRRLTKTFDGESTRWVWDGDVVLHEVDDERGAQCAITWVFDEDRFAPAARLDGDGVHSVVTDHLSTPVSLLGEDGAPGWQANIDAWGAMQTTGERGLCPWRFPGQYEDEQTGLYYNRFRYYDPRTGDYLSRDPIGLIGGLRLYGYVGDPTSACDPLGLSSRQDYMSIAGVDPAALARKFNSRFGQSPGSIWVVGSHAQGVATKNSDIDMFFETDLDLVKWTGEGWEFFKQINPGKIPGWATGWGPAPGQILLGVNVPKGGVIDPFFGPLAKLMPEFPHAKVW